MANQVYANNASAVLASGITDSATTITVATGQGASFPTVSGGNWAYITLVDTSGNVEIVKCTSHSAAADTFTCTRGQDGTTARAFSANDLFELRVTKATLDTLRDVASQTSGTLNGVIIGGGTPAAITGTTITANTGFSGALNGTVGATTPATGAFTTLTATGNVTLGDASGDSVTINASTVGCANGLNFDSNTFVIDATNNRVGIGTSSPAYALDASVDTGTTVVGNGTVARFVSSTTDGDANIRLGSGSNSTVRFGANGTAAYIYTNGAERVRIDSSGNVGIGTSSPNQKLHVFGNAVDTAAKITKNGTDSIMAGVDSEAYLAAGGAIALRTGGFTSAYDKAKLDASGNFLVGVSSATTNGGKIETSNGVTFPVTQSACSNANTLDDYEEGTWSAADNSADGLTLTLSGCKYQKVGNRVTIAGKITYPAGGTGIPALVTLPITAASTATASSVVVNDAGVSVGLLVLGSSSTTTLFIKNPTSAAAINNSALAGKTMYLLLSYEAA